MDAEDRRIQREHFQPEASGSNPLVELPTALIDPSSSNSAPALIPFPSFLKFKLIYRQNSVANPSGKGKEPAIEIDYDPVSPHPGITRPTSGTTMSSSAVELTSNKPVLATTRNVNDSSGQPVNRALSDDKRTTLHYAKAVKDLKKSLELGRENWDGVAFPDVEGVSETITQMRGELETALNAWTLSRDNPDLWSKAKHRAAQVFTATSPFFKNFLIVAMNAQSVRPLQPPQLIPLQIPVLNPYGLVVGGLMLFMTVNLFVTELIL